MARNIRIPDPRRLPARKNVFCADFPTAARPNGQRVTYATTDEVIANERHQWLVDAWSGLGRRGLPEPTTYPWRMREAAIAFVGVNSVIASYETQQQADACLPDGTLRDRYNVAAAMNTLREALPNKNMLNLRAGDVEAVGRAMILKKWAHATIRDRMRHVRQAIRQAVKQGILSMDVLAHLTLVEKIKKSTPGIPRREKVRAVPAATIDATTPHLNRHVRAIVEVLRWSGARPSEVCSLRVCDLVTEGDVLTCVLQHHKTADRETADGSERRRELVFGPQAKAALAPFLVGRRRLDAYVFDPRAAEAERRESMHAARVTPIGYGNSPGTNLKDRPQVTIGDRYTVPTLRRAIHRACESNGIDRWNVYQLRHTAATYLRSKMGIEAAALALGHADATLTASVYAEGDRSKTIEIMSRFG